MQIGTYLPDGKPLNFDENARTFSVGSMKVTMNAVIAWDDSGQIAWDRPDVRGWMLSQPTKAPAAAAAAAAAPASPKGRTHPVVWVVVAAVVVFVLCTCLTIASSVGKRLGGGASLTATPTVDAPGNGLVVTETSSVTEGYGLRYVTGTVVNQSKRKYGYVQVEINTYDSSGALVGSTMANANNLEAGGTWKFKAPLFDEAATSFKVNEVSGY